MGTRGEVYVRNSNSVIELWRHYDTYAEYMVPYFKDFARYAAWCAGSQRHWLTYPENVAAMLIAYDHELVLASHLRFARTGLCEAAPDLRPRGCINDFEKVWILDICARARGCKPNGRRRLACARLQLQVWSRRRGNEGEHKERKGWHAWHLPGENCGVSHQAKERQRRVQALRLPRSPHRRGGSALLHLLPPQKRDEGRLLQG